MCDEVAAPAPFSWLDYLSLAENLSKSDDEASLRSSVSRAYYAVYHAALQKARALGTPPDGQSHASLWKFYRSGPGARSWFRRVRETGRSLQEQRERADYEIETADDWRATSESAVEDARKLIEDLQGYR